MRKKWTDRKIISKKIPKIIEVRYKKIKGWIHLLFGFDFFFSIRVSSNKNVCILKIIMFSNLSLSTSKKDLHTRCKHFSLHVLSFSGYRDHFTYTYDVHNDVYIVINFINSLMTTHSKFINVICLLHFTFRSSQKQEPNKYGG